MRRRWFPPGLVGLSRGYLGFSRSNSSFFDHGNAKGRKPSRRQGCEVTIIDRRTP
jgi:hypothetical protein